MTASLEGAEPAAHGGVAAAVRGLPLIDHHCHGVVTADLDRDGFEALISEAGAPAPGTTNFDTPLGLAIRRHCAPLLDLPPHAPPEAYLARRAELGTAEVTRRLLAATGTARFVVDTGFRPRGLTTPAQLGAVPGVPANEIVRLESVAEDVAAAGVDPAGLGTAVASALHDAVARRGAVGVKTVAAYRVGFRLDPARPTPAEVTRAAAAWLAAGPRPDGAWRLADPVLTRHLLWTAVDLGRPIQVHVGLGDPDIRMPDVDPGLLTDWLAGHRVPVMLLHCWPYHRTAAFLAAVHPHVHLDVGLALHYVGPGRAAAVLAEAAELAPFGKLLYSSDAYGVPELYLVAAVAFRRALAELLQARVVDGEWSAADAVRIAGLVGWGNAARVYGLDVPQPPDAPTVTA
jgi:uncharacterized protein